MTNHPMKKPWVRILTTVLVLALMGGIFFFSGQRKADTEAASEVFAFVIIDAVHPEYSELNQYQQIDIWNIAQHIVRKAAHLMEYLVLGLLIRFCLESWFGDPKKNKRNFWLSFGIGALYAVSDEVHQYFVPGRSCEVMDVLIDSLGVFLGVLIAGKIIRTILKNQGKEYTPVEPWTKKQLAGSLFLAVLTGGILTVCLHIGLNYLRPGSAGSVKQNLLFFAAFSLVMAGGVLLCDFCAPVRRAWLWLNEHFLNPETRKPFLDICYAALAIPMLLHHFYVLLYYPTIPAGASKLAPVWIILAALTVLMGRTWKDRGFSIAALFLIYTFERYYVKTLGVDGGASVYFSAAMYAMFLAYGLFFAVRKAYRRPILLILCAVWCLCGTAMCCAGLYFSWTGIPVYNLVGARIWSWGRLSIFSKSVITAANTSSCVVIALAGFAAARRKFVKVLFLIPAVIAILTTALTDSRSSLMMLAFMISGTICLGIWGLWCITAEKNNYKKRIPLLAVALVACFGLFFWLSIQGQHGIKNGFIEIRNRGGLITSTALAEEEIPSTEEVTITPESTPEPTVKPTTPPPSFWEREVWISNTDDINSQLSGRYTIWQDVVHYIAEHPNTLAAGLSIDGSVATAVNREDHVHNILLQTLMEGGIPGLLLFLALVAYFFFHTIRLWKNWHLPLWQRILPLPALSILFMEMAECLSHFSFGHPPMTVLWLFMGCTVAMSKSLKDSEKITAAPAVGG